MDESNTVPFMQIASASRPAQPRVRRGMSTDEIREVWRARAEAKSKEIMDKFYAQRRGGDSRESFGIFGRFKSRAAAAKIRLAEQLVKSAGLPLDEATIRKIMRSR